jgi:membrane protease YdiL (CAAX protease family)
MADDRTSHALSRADWIAVGVALLLPTAVTWLYFIALDGAERTLQQGAYTIGKAIQFALPVVWICLVQRQWPKIARPKAWSLIVGLALGLAIGAAMLVLYLAILKPTGLLAGPTAAVRAKIESFGAGSPATFVALACFYSAVHSLLEEYYWRWFVFGQLARGCKLPAAIAISSGGFAAHHVLVLELYFGWTSPLTWLFTLCIIVGGALWAWLYRASGSLAGPWISHALVDAAIFAIGYQMLVG